MTLYLSKISNRLFEIVFNYKNFSILRNNFEMKSLNESSPSNIQTETNLSADTKRKEFILPDKPVTVIEPRLSFFNFYELWQFRDLIYILTLRDIKVRYKQTILGVLWVIVQPLLMMLIFTLFFGRLAGIPSDGIPYPLFAYAGLLPWTFFSNSLNNSSNSLVGNSALITKVYFPRMILPLAAVCAGLFDFLIAFVMLVVLMFYYGIAFSWSLLMLPVLTVMTALWTIGLGMLMSALNVKFRDIRYALPFFIQLMLFITPIIYPLNFISEKWRWMLLLNPLTGIIEGFRSSIFGKPFDVPNLFVSMFVITVVLIYSIFTFRKLERGFADII